MKEKEKRLKHLQDKKEANFKAKQLVDKVEHRLATQNFSTVLESFGIVVGRESEGVESASRGNADSAGNGANPQRNGGRASQGEGNLFEHFLM